MYRSLLVPLLIFLLSVFAGGQVKKETPKPLPIYFTRIVIPTDSPNCKIQIGRNGISPREEYCRFDGHLEVGTKVTLVKTTNEGGWMKLDLSVDNSERFAIFLDASRGSRYEALFETILSRTAVEAEGSSCEMKTKRDVITVLGFPYVLNRNAGSESWEYGIGHPSAGRYCGFDAMTIGFKGNIVTSVGGIV